MRIDSISLICTSYLLIDGGLSKAGLVDACAIERKLEEYQVNHCLNFLVKQWKKRNKN